MSWIPQELRLDSLEPNVGRVGDTIQITGKGAGIVQGAKLMLVKTGSALHPQDVITGDKFAIVKGNFDVEFSVMLDGIRPGTYDAIIWNPPADQKTTSERFVLVNAFEVEDVRTHGR